jgi:hypothetical protein
LLTAIMRQVAEGHHFRALAERRCCYGHNFGRHGRPGRVWHRFDLG